MKQIDTTQIVEPNILQPFTGRSLKFLQGILTDTLIGLFRGLIGSTYNTSVPYAIQGLGFTGSVSLPTAVFTGWIFFNDELYQCLGNGTPFAVGPVFNVSITQDPTADPLLFTDGNNRNVHNIRNLAVTDATPGSGLFNLSDVVYFQDSDIFNASVINGWTNFVTVKYFKDRFGKMNIDGVITGAVGVPSSVIMFVLPVGFRPTTQKIIPVVWDDSGSSPRTHPGIVRVNTNGNVEFLSVNDPQIGTQIIYLAGISFYLGW